MSKLLLIQKNYLALTVIVAAAGLKVDELLASGKDALKNAMQSFADTAVGQLLTDVGVKPAEGQSASDAIKAAITAQPKTDADAADLQAKLTAAADKVTAYAGGLQKSGIKLADGVELTAETLSKAITDRNSTKARELLAAKGLAELLDEELAPDPANPKKPAPGAKEEISPVARIARSVRIV